jgi:hypothetical protein
MTAKKDFRRDPATAFISSATEKTEKPPKKATSSPSSRAKKEAPTGYKLNPDYVETKSRRVQALVQPSVYESVKAKAEAKGISTNEAINEAMKLWAQKS